MPYNTQTGEYIPLTILEIQQMVVDNINQEFGLNYNQTSILGTNFAKLFYTGVQFMVATEENFKLANQAVVQKIINTGFASTTLTPTSRPYIIQELARLVVEDDIKLFKYIRIEETATAGQIALFVVPNPAIQTAYDDGAYDELIVNTLFQISAIATKFGTRSTTMFTGATEVKKDIDFIDDIVTGLSFSIYNCNTTSIDEAKIIIKGFGAGVNVDAVKETFLNNFNNIYNGGTYVPEKYINVTLIPDSVEVYVKTTVGTKVFDNDGSISGVFLSLDKENIIVEVN